MQTFVKQDVTDLAIRKTGLNPKDVAKVVDSVFVSLRELLMEGEFECRLRIRDFGTFAVKRTQARHNARNPRQPDKQLYIPPRRKVTFRPGKQIKDYLDQPLE